MVRAAEESSRETTSGTSIGDQRSSIDWKGLAKARKPPFAHARVSVANYSTWNEKAAFKKEHGIQYLRV